MTTRIQSISARIFYSFASLYVVFFYCPIRSAFFSMIFFFWLEQMPRVISTIFTLFASADNGFTLILPPEQVSHSNQIKICINASANENARHRHLAIGFFSQHFIVAFHLTRNIIRVGFSSTLFEFKFCN